MNLSRLAEGKTAPRAIDAALTTIRANMPAAAKMAGSALRSHVRLKIVIVVRDEGGDLVFRASIVFNVEAEQGLVCFAILARQSRLIQEPALDRVALFLSCRRAADV
ncbi:hypothetical protein [Mesorhizobium sp. CO1-1-8]|uniref:hypothetical protein n=1 Tax=Mesorhizobium sp. CO1-1-8 TaxID=2876631 RepID=UPI001CD08BF8|nr:hypothetical protein [Mesorhizobium sp. CO1-1-8]MBZ9776859.1 hypothetical protein [Mesorhizobium sp. CO1-1-8]